MDRVSYFPHHRLTLCDVFVVKLNTIWVLHSVFSSSAFVLFKRILLPTYPCLVIRGVYAAGAPIRQPTQIAALLKYLKCAICKRMLISWVSVTVRLDFNQRNEKRTHIAVATKTYSTTKQSNKQEGGSRDTQAAVLLLFRYSILTNHLSNTHGHA